MNYSNLFNNDRPTIEDHRNALERILAAIEKIKATPPPARFMELQIQLIIKALGGDGTEQGLVQLDSFREKAMRLLYALEEAAK